MSNNLKIILSAVIAVGLVSLLFAIVPITDSFIVSYIFILIAIAGITTGLCLFGKGSSSVPQGYAFVHISVVYTVINVLFSLVACILKFSLKWALLPHIAILGIFIIAVIIIESQSSYINEIEEDAEKKHKAFENEKENYWR